MLVRINKLKVINFFIIVLDMLTNIVNTLKNNEV